VDHVLSCVVYIIIYVSVMSKLEGPLLASCHTDIRFIMRIKKSVEVIDRIFIDIVSFKTVGKICSYYTYPSLE
jgi:hypothetical protein